MAFLRCLARFGLAFDALNASQDFFVLVDGFLQVGFEFALGGDVAMTAKQLASVAD